MSAQVLLNLLKDLRNSDKMRGLLCILLLFCNKFNNVINTGARMSYDIKITLKSYLGVKT